MLANAGVTQVVTRVVAAAGIQVPVYIGGTWLHGHSLIYVSVVCGGHVTYLIDMLGSPPIIGNPGGGG